MNQFNALLQTLWQRYRSYVPILIVLCAIFLCDSVLSYGVSIDNLLKSLQSSDDIYPVVHSINDLLFFSLYLCTMIAIVSISLKRIYISHLLVIFNTLTITLRIIESAVLLVITISQRQEGNDALSLFLDALIVWWINIVIFAIWYWSIDSGGPYIRCSSSPWRCDFAFPQHTNDDLRGWERGKWHPRFLDYLFLAFNTSTAFSPTDTLVLSHRGKLLTMLQACISLSILVALVARAINSIA